MTTRTDEQQASDSEPEKRDRPRGPLSRFGNRASEAGAATIEQGPQSLEAHGGEATSARVRVDDHGVQRPFMLGSLVHSLTESGLSFEDAYGVAREIWSRVRDRAVVTTKELRELAAELSTAVSGGQFQAIDLSTDDALEVLGPDGRWPFSQARIQQSLLAAAVEPRQAFEVATEVERELRQMGDRKVTRDAIRTLAAEILARHIGAASAARYQAWRDFQGSDERPVVILLGGTSGVGKSTLALEVARRLTIGRVLSTDSIRDVMRVMVSDDLVPTLHVSSFEAHTRLVTELREGLDPVIEGFLEQSRTVAVGVRAVIERAVVEGTSTVLDGVSLVPGLFDLDAWLDRAHVFFLVAADVDRESLHGHLIARAHGKGARASERYVRNFKEIFRIQEDLLERAAVFGVPVVDVQDSEVAAQQVVAHVVGRLAELRAAEQRVD